ncbi:GntR family transcriptional regulator [Desulforhopalus singaporensis]|nr:GntR family transcriptional regulator [Desulforhopalus singaporensis]
MKSLMAYEKIRDMILKGQKLPGTRLIIADLETELEIGKGPIREALMRLDRSGLVQNIPYKGAVVATPPTPREILYIYELRKELESMLAVAALDSIAGKDIAELEKLHDLMLAMPHDHYQCDIDFHFCIYRAANLPHLYNIAKAYIFSVESVLNVYRRKKGHIIKFNAEHYDIIQALKSGDREKVRKAMAQNIESGLAIIRETYDDLLQQPFD